MSEKINVSHKDVTPKTSELSEVQEKVLKANNQPKEVTLSDGTRVTFEKPKGLVSMRIAEYLGNDSMNPALNLWFKMLHNITAIDGVSVRPPQSRLEVYAIAERLKSDDNVNEALYHYYQFLGISPDQVDSFLGDNDPAKK